MDTSNTNVFEDTETEQMCFSCKSLTTELNYSLYNVEDITEGVCGNAEAVAVRLLSTGTSPTVLAQAGIAERVGPALSTSNACAFYVQMADWKVMNQDTGSDPGMKEEHLSNG
jgi:hypothetical protein